ncbi:unnamed protein product [Hydatigera taeniaeformis]|uniref:PK_Tyr_Ser-Thr domain-containing protein n=1 Tax=Hydatigena taeniaeformis TaxID=6205 RepID=A0A0R3WJS2_HYDTA|nr:unnamed protein product [Hydatigera taeniaeformis]
MQTCWHRDPECRPSFGTIISMLEPYVSPVFRTNSFYLNQNLNSRRQEAPRVNFGGDGEALVKGREVLFSVSDDFPAKEIRKVDEDRNNL